MRAGTDIAFLGGLIHYALTHDAYQREYVKVHTNASFLIKEGFSFDEGLFSGWDETKKAYDKSTWGYELDAQGSCESRRHAGASTFGLPADEGALLAVYARDGGVHLRLLRRRLREDGCGRLLHFRTGPAGHHSLRPGLDAAQSFGTAHSHCRHAAAHARQHRNAGRRHQRAARPLQHSGRHRYGRLEHASRLPSRAACESADFRPISSRPRPKPCVPIR